MGPGISHNILLFMWNGKRRNKLVEKMNLKMPFSLEILLYHRKRANEQDELGLCF